MADPQSPSNHQTFDAPAPGAGESPGFWKQTGTELGAAARDPVEGAKGAAKGTLGLSWDVMKLGEIVENKGRDALGWLIGEDIPHYKSPDKPKILEPSNDAQKGGDKATTILGLAGLAKGLAKQGIKVTVKLSKGSDEAGEALGDSTRIADDTAKAGDDTAKAGRRGSAATRADIDAQRDAILKEHPDWAHTNGGTDELTGVPKKELYVPGPDGTSKGATYPDLSFKKPDGTYHHHNTVDTYADGVTPTKREAANAARLQERMPNDTYTFSPKPKPQK